VLNPKSLESGGHTVFTFAHGTSTDTGDNGEGRDWEQPERERGVDNSSYACARVLQAYALSEGVHTIFPSMHPYLPSSSICHLQSTAGDLVWRAQGLQLCAFVSRSDVRGVFVKLLSTATGYSIGR